MVVCDHLGKMAAPEGPCVSLERPYRGGRWKGVDVSVAQTLGSCKGGILCRVHSLDCEATLHPGKRGGKREGSRVGEEACVMNSVKSSVRVLRASYHRSQLHDIWGHKLMSQTRGPRVG